MVMSLLEEGDEEGLQLSGRLRSLLSRWLTTPVEFDHKLLESLEVIGSGAGFETRWGLQIAKAYKDACRAARELAGAPNPLREKLAEVVEEFVRAGGGLRIYCHRSSLPDFQSLFQELVENDLFLHSPRDYRESDTFETLVKVGPLRSRGWGAVPDAVLTAPRFSRLVQFVWTGCQDEPDFGYDPVNLSAASGPGLESEAGARNAHWIATTTQTGDDPSISAFGPDEDDLRILTEFGRSADRSRCVLVQFRGQQGALYSPRADVLSFDPSTEADESIGFRTPCDGLFEGIFVVQSLLDDFRSEAAQAEEGSFSQTWKKQLKEIMSEDGEGFIGRLRSEGISLIHLHASVWQWCKPASTVVRAPQRRKHFEILIRCLGLDHPAGTPERIKKLPWWRSAWSEVTKTRGEAIQLGMHEHRAADDRLVELLKARIEEIRQAAGGNESFTITVPDDGELDGMIIFHKIEAVEEGFLAPICDLRMICDLEEIEQWRE